MESCAFIGQMTAREFEHIAQILRPQMMRVAWDFFRQTEEAEDVVQEVLMRLWIRMEKGELVNINLPALAIKATKNLCVSTWRKQKLRRAEQLNEDLYHFSNEIADSALLTEEEIKRFDDAISQLPRSEQRLLRMKQKTDLSSDEIADITGIPVRSVRTIISSARRNLLKLLKQ